MYQESDVFLIDGKEYKLRGRNPYDYCWMEPVLVRYSGYIVSGGKNLIIHYDNLSDYEYVEWR